MPIEMPDLERDGIGRERLCPRQAGEGPSASLAKVLIRMPNQATPVAAGDADQAEDQDGDHLGQVRSRARV